jgi:molybdopterin molybdotransferase
VLPAEHADRTGDKLDAREAPRAGRHLRRAGEDVPAGAEVLPAGTAVTATVAGLAAAVGLDVLTVRRRPRVAALLTGAELVHAGASRDGRVRDAVGPALPGWVAALGGEPLPVASVPEAGPGALVAAIRDAPADVVVTSGGAGGGPVDQVAPALRELGATVLVDGVDCRPGRPQRLALLPDGRPLVALPGSPYAGLVAALTLLAPLLAARAGRPLRTLPTASLRRPPAGTGRVTTRVVPVRWAGAGEVEPVGLDRPGSLWGAALADAYAVVPADHRAGGPVGLLTL